MGSLAKQREHEIEAKDEAEQTRAEVDRVRREIGVAQAEMRKLQGERRRTTAEAHEKVEALRAASLAQARAGLVEYLPALRTNEPVPAPPSPEIVAAFMAASAPEFWQALHEAIDAEPGDPRSMVFSGRTPAEIDADLAARQRQVDELRGELRRRQRDHDEARGVHAAATEGR